MGLLVGLECEDGKATQKALIENKILVGTSSDPGRIRLLPPLTLSDDELREFLTRWEDL